MDGWIDGSMDLWIGVLWFDGLMDGFMDYTIIPLYYLTTSYLFALCIAISRTSFVTSSRVVSTFLSNKSTK